MDVRLPKEIVKAHKGPAFGIKGIRKLVKVPDRPLIRTIIKPKTGLNTRDHAPEAYDAWVGGVDIVKDDENLTGQKFNSFYKRVKETLKKRDWAERKTGERKMYMTNVTAATTDEILRRAEYVQEQGEYVMIDVCIVGWPTLQTLREHNEDIGLVLHAHRAMHAAYTRNEKHGISMLVLSKFLRLCGLDQLHIGSMVGK
jgi:ribulose-bisphosphate carboxylase large chain